MDFTVLASGSSGNVSLLRVAGFGVLVDLGLGPAPAREPAANGGQSPGTRSRQPCSPHAHSDDGQRRCASSSTMSPSLLPCRTRGRPRSAEHGLCRPAPSASLQGSRRNHARDRPAFLALPLSHDSGPTCGFRLDGPDGAVGYATDLGTWHCPWPRGWPTWTSWRLSSITTSP